jgi:dTDP-4-amino-4,6-dideoxygalactose transaminase
LHSSPFGRTLRPDGDVLPVAERVAATLVRLPIHPLLSDEDIGRVIEAVRVSLG